MRLTPLLLALSLSGTLATAQSYDAGDFSFAFQLGGNKPFSTLADVASTGWNFYGDATYNLSERFRLRTEIGFSSNTAKIPYNNLGIGGRIGNWSLGENVVFSLSPQSDIDWYVTAGLAYHYVEAKLDRTVYYPAGYWDPWYGWWGGYYGSATLASKNTSKAGGNAGAGVAFRTGDAVSVFFEVRYVRIATDPAIEYVPFTVGVRF
jgi:opacity protein-like surface antigen